MLQNFRDNPPKSSSSRVSQPFSAPSRSALPIRVVKCFCEMIYAVFAGHERDERSSKEGRRPYPPAVYLCISEAFPTLRRLDKSSSVRRKHMPLEVHDLSYMVDSMDRFIHVVIHEQLSNTRNACNFRYQSESQMYYKHRTAPS